MGSRPISYYRFDSPSRRPNMDPDGTGILLGQGPVPLHLLSFLDSTLPHLRPSALQFDFVSHYAPSEPIPHYFFFFFFPCALPTPPHVLIFPFLCILSLSPHPTSPLFMHSAGVPWLSCPPLYPPYVISFLISALLHGLAALISAHQYTSMHFIMFSPLLRPLPGSGLHLLHNEQCLIISFMLPNLEILSCKCT